MENLNEVEYEALRGLHEGYKALELNPYFSKMMEHIAKEREAAILLVTSGDFPRGADGELSDLQGIYYREQIIGEIRGLNRAGTFLASLKSALSDELDRRATAQKEQN